MKTKKERTIYGNWRVRPYYRYWAVAYFGSCEDMAHTTSFHFDFKEAQEAAFERMRKEESNV